MNDNHTPPRSMRIPDRLWKPAKAKAALERRTVTDVVIEALTLYVNEPTAPRE